MRFRVSKAAQREMDRIFVYWARRGSVEGADKLIDSIEARFRLLGDNPGIGRKCEGFARGVLAFTAGKYLIYYRKSRGSISILHVVHGARDQLRALNPEGPE